MDLALKLKLTRELIKLSENFTGIGKDYLKDHDTEQSFKIKRRGFYVSQAPECLLHENSDFISFNFVSYVPKTVPMPS